MSKILYFVRGGVASPDQKKEAAELGALIRNASIGANDFIEKCDAVAGDVPERYKHYPLVGSEGQPAASGQPAPIADKPLAEMSNRELEGEAEKLGIKFPAAVNTKAERVAYIEALLAENAAS